MPEPISKMRRAAVLSSVVEPKSGFVLGKGGFLPDAGGQPPKCGLMPRLATGGSEFGEHAISKPRRPRWTPTEDAKALLEKVFSADSFPTFAVRSQLAQQLSIDSRQVQIWFQNRRQRERLKTGSNASALTEMDEEDDSPTGLQVVVPPRAALLDSLNDGEPPSGLCQSDTQTTWDIRDAGARTLTAARSKPHAARLYFLTPLWRCAGADVTRLADTRLAGGTPNCSVLLPACGPAPLARSLSPRSAGSDDTSHTSLVNPSTLSLQTSPLTSPLLTSSPALDTLVAVGGAASGSSSMCSAVLPDAAQVARTLELPGGGTVDLPSGAPPALRQMFDTPGGSRALQLAARSLLRNNPILQHPGLLASTPHPRRPAPNALLFAVLLAGLTACATLCPPAGAPCHALLTSLANMQQQQRSGAGPLPALAPAAPEATGAVPTAVEGAAAPRGAVPRSSFRRSDASSEALEVLSSQFFSPAPPSSRLF